MKIMDQGELLLVELSELRRQHRALDEAITALSASPLADPLLLKRLKKRKLRLKDLIAQAADGLYPDIIA